jgi:hypothetical protein
MAEALDTFGNQGQKPVPVSVGPEDALPVVAPDYDVVTRSWKVHARLSSHTNKDGTRVLNLSMPGTPSPLGIADADLAARLAGEWPHDRDLQGVISRCGYYRWNRPWNHPFHELSNLPGGLEPEAVSRSPSEDPVIVRCEPA